MAADSKPVLTEQNVTWINSTHQGGAAEQTLIREQPSPEQEAQIRQQQVWQQLPVEDVYAEAPVLTAQENQILAASRADDQRIRGVNFVQPGVNVVNVVPMTPRTSMQADGSGTSGANSANTQEIPMQPQEEESGIDNWEKLQEISKRQ